MQSLVLLGTEQKRKTERERKRKGAEKGKMKISGSPTTIFSFIFQRRGPSFVFFSLLLVFLLVLQNITNSELVSVFFIGWGGKEMGYLHVIIPDQVAVQTSNALLKRKLRVFNTISPRGASSSDVRRSLKFLVTPVLSAMTQKKSGAPPVIAGAAPAKEGKNSYAARSMEWGILIAPCSRPP